MRLRCGPVVLELTLPAGQALALHAGDEAELFTHLQLSTASDSLRLYGFISELSRDLFATLITGPGVGPRVALALLDLGEAGLVAAIRDADEAALSSGITYTRAHYGFGRKLMPQPARFIHTIVRATALLPLFLSPLLLAAAGLLAPAIAEEDGGAAAGGAAAAAEELDSVNEIEARYQPLLPLETTNVGVAYELFRQPNGELAATVIMPSWDNVEECELFPAMDLMAFIGHVSRRDPGFKALALELAAWSMPPDATNIASIQLAMVHAYGGDPEAEGMPELSVVGDATSLMDDVYEVIILHPGNIPIAGAMVVPVEGGDSFGISMLWAGTLPALDPPDADPDVAGMADMGAESAAEDRFYIPPRCRPPTELMATGELDCYEVIRKSDGKPVTTLFVPAWARLVIAGKLPAMDLARLMSEISQLDNSYQDVGATLLAQEAPAEMPNLPCYQLQVIHSICGDAEHAESMPEFEPYGDSTMLRGAERSCIIVHPRNVPIFGALAYPQCEGDDFNNLLTIIGELVFVD